jgi:hypothetical protein
MRQQGYGKNHPFPFCLKKISAHKAGHRIKNQVGLLVRGDDDQWEGRNSA